MIRIEPRAGAPAGLRVLVSACAVALALLLAALPLAAAGAPVGRALILLLDGAAGTPFAAAETLTRATPLVLTGLAVAVAFRARLFNIGAEGQLYAGALATVALGSGALDLPAPLLLPLLVLAAALAGGLLMLGPALLKSRLGVDEVVTTLLLNFVVLLLVQMLLEGPLKDPMGGGWPQSAPVLDAGVLPPLAERMRLHWGLPLALAAAIGCHVLLSRTAAGLRMRAVGENPDAAGYAGLPVGGVTALAGLLSGGLAGVAGMSEVAGLKGYLTADLSRGFGYAGITVAMLAGLRPLLVVPAAVLVAGVFVGADGMSRTLGVSNYIADLIVALTLLCVLLGGLVLRYRVRLR